MGGWHAVSGKARAVATATGAWNITHFEFSPTHKPVTVTTSNNTDTSATNSSRDYFHTLTTGADYSFEITWEPNTVPIHQYGRAEPHHYETVWSAVPELTDTSAIRGDWVEYNVDDKFTGWRWTSPTLQEPNDEDHKRLEELAEKRNKDFLKKEQERKEERLQARAKSMELLQGWLTAMEYRMLTDQGELEIPSSMEANTVFVVKRDPYSKVLKKVGGKPTEELCVVLENDGYPDGDILLSKILLLKSDPVKFQKIANVYPVAA